MRLCLGRQTSFWGCISKRIHNGGHSSQTKSRLKRERERERDGYRPQWQSLVPMTREMDHTNSHSHKRIHTWPLILAAFKNERERERERGREMICYLRNWVFVGVGDAACEEGICLLMRCRRRLLSMVSLDAFICRRWGDVAAKKKTAL